jgi:hypothetical protein
MALNVIAPCTNVKVSGRLAIQQTQKNAPVLSLTLENAFGVKAESFGILFLKAIDVGDQTGVNLHDLKVSVATPATNLR